MQRDQAEVTQQLSSLQSKMRVSYGNDALMPDLPDSTTPLDNMPPEQDGMGFIHPESFNQANTDNHGKHLHLKLETSEASRMITDTELSIIRKKYCKINRDQVCFTSKQQIWPEVILKGLNLCQR